jgi:hypothetical protein
LDGARGITQQHLVDYHKIRLGAETKGAKFVVKADLVER